MATFELLRGRADLTGLAGCTTCGVPALAKQPLRRRVTGLQAVISCRSVSTSPTV